MISYELRRSKRKTISVEVLPSGSVIVRAPTRLPLYEVEQFLAVRQSWVASQVQKAELRRSLVPQRTHDRQFYHRGKILTWGGQGADLVLPEQITDTNAAIRWLTRWQRREAQLVFEAMIQDHVAVFGVHGLRYAGLRLRRMRRRWGSCTRTGQITLNQVLVQAPDICIRSVIVHELCHLVHMDHGKQFRQLMLDVYPEHELADKILDCWTSVLFE